MKAAGLPLRFIVTPNTGHWYPEDLSVKINEGIRFIREEKQP